MSDVYSSKQRQQALAQLIERSAMDDALRARLLDSPNATLREETGVEPDVPVRFVEPGSTAGLEASGNEHTIVLPAAMSEELSEDQLEAVSGGTGSGLLDHLGL